MRTRSRLPLLLLFFGAGPSLAAEEPGGWILHTIDASSRGADGVRLADLDGDGRLDIATAWEEGGQIRVCLNPGPSTSTRPWPSVFIGRVRSPEDAVIVDIDDDGAPDLVTCSEGRTRTVHVHWAPKDPNDRLDPDSWRTEALPATVDVQMWMWCVPMRVDNRHGVDLVLGGKGPDAAIGWLEAPEDPRDLSAWSWHPIRPAGWIMTIRPLDLDDDGDLDLLVSDRKGPRRGVFWLERGGSPSDPEWTEHPIGGADSEVMFLDAHDLDGDGVLEILAAARDRGLWIFRRAGGPDAWDASAIDLGLEVGTGKAVSAGDLDGDGQADLVVSTENATGRQGVIWLDRTDEDVLEPWAIHPLSGSRIGIKFDLVRLIDLDDDGDLDVLTCEERDNLGVIWYENPTR